MAGAGAGSLPFDPTMDGGGVCLNKLESMPTPVMMLLEQPESAMVSREAT